MNDLNVNNTRNGSIFLGVVLAVLLLSVSGWGACTVSSTNSNYRVPEECSIGAVVGTNGQFLTRVVGCNVKICWIDYAGDSKFNCSDNCPNGWEFRGYKCNTETLKCDNVCEVDSIVCLQNGGTWANTGASTCDGKSCKIPVCKQADTHWLDSAKAACDALGGENNFAITEVGETCIHSGTCCASVDSIPAGNTCKWRCDSALTQCNGRVGSLFGAVLPDTSVSGEDTTFSYQCFYNCAYSPNPDSTVYLVEGNTVLSGPNDSIADGIKSETFNSVRTTTGGVYVYDYLSPSASEYIDSIAAMKCVEHLWRCVINSKYVYWYDNQEVPAGCTNIVRVK